MSEMTATRIGSPVRLLTLAALAGVWAVAAYFLWATTKVPDGIEESGLRARDFFTAHQLSAGRHFEQFFWIDSLLALALTILVFVLYARWGKRFIRDSAAGPIGTGMLLTMIGFALVWLVQLPFGLAALWWARRHGESHEPYQDVIFGGWIALGVNFVFLCIAVLIAMGFARVAGHNWWIPAGVVFVALFGLRVFLDGYLVAPGKDKVESAEIRADFERLEKAEGVSHMPLRVEKVSDDTDAVNAYTTGFAMSRRVVVWDTLLAAPYNRREIDFVLAHEIGHQARYHLVKLIGWYALFNFPLVFAVAFVTRRRGGLGNPEAVPLALLVVVIFNTATIPLQAGISRHMEKEADWMALQATRDPASGQAVFRRFTETNHGDPNPPTWAYLWFEGHPTDMQRIGMVRAWARREGVTLPPAGS